MLNSTDLFYVAVRFLKNTGLSGVDTFLRLLRAIAVSLTPEITTPATSNTVPESALAQVIVEPGLGQSSRTTADNPFQTSGYSPLWTTTSPLGHKQRLVASLLTSYPSAAAVLDGSVDFSQDLYADQVTLVPHSTGGYSDVHKAKLTRGSNEIYVAIKVLRPVNINEKRHDTQRRLIRRMLREMRVWKCLDHRRILPLLGYAVLDTTPCLISLWCPNGTVLEYLERYPDADRYTLVLQACEGLVFLHGSQPPVVHSDLKGNNVLVNNAGEAMLSDFGLSKFLEAKPSGLSTSPMVMGAMRWRAPELFTDNSGSTTQSDIYSFGCLVLEGVPEIITGSIPFRKYKSDVSLMCAKLAGEMIVPADYPEIDQNDLLWSTLGRCWTPNPAERPVAAEVLAELRSLQGKQGSKGPQI
ncbi:hypothetical protein FRB99_001852 [Tulasnella sp. 403]|nr:hypothetical protein FRB99_001852 [Tulasnella sp. 403]